MNRMNLCDWIIVIGFILVIAIIVTGFVVVTIQENNKIKLVDEITVDVENMVYLDFTPEGTFYHGTPDRFTESEELIKYLDINMTYATHPRYFKIGRTYYCVVPNTLTYENYGEK